eukprot:1194876-Amphidinium_carterae.1
MDSLEAWETTWLQWEADLHRYEKESGKTVAAEIKVSVILNRAPQQIAAQLQMQASEFEEDYEHLRGILRTYLEAARRYQGGGTSSKP